MSNNLALATKTMLPASFSKLLSTPSESKIEQLWWYYKGHDKSLNETYELVTSSLSNYALSLLLRSSTSGEAINCSFSSCSLEKSSKLLQQDYWTKAIELTDVLHHMPNNRKLEWRESVNDFKFPEFTLENLYTTLSTLLMERDKFVAERVDGVFQALSREHVTNSPSGFYKRMIINHVHRDGNIDHGTCGYISDLRLLVARSMSREGEKFINSYNLVYDILNQRRTGEWMDVDGGALRLRVYKKGTAHLEVHPDVAWELNEILSLLYPRAIPTEMRVKAKSKVKAVKLTQSLISFEVVSHLREVEQARDFCHKRQRYLGHKANTYTPRYPHSMDKHIRRQVSNVLKAIGGVEVDNYEFKFDYDPMSIIQEICMSGSLPDKLSHQYFPTPDVIGERMFNKLCAASGDKLLEPSAGQGNLAKYLETDSTLIEVSQLHCDILKKKGFNDVVKADFLKWSEEARDNGQRFDGVLMNPPFSEGRATQHVAAAVSLLSSNGRVVALTTRAVATRLCIMGCEKEIEFVDTESFKGVSVELAIITLKRI